MVSILRRHVFLTVLILLCGRTGLGHIAAADSKPLNLTNVGIVSVPDDSLPAKAVEILADEIAKRTDIHVPLLNDGPNTGSPAIVIQTLAQFDHSRLPTGLEVPHVADAYAIWTEHSGSNTTIVLLGYDDRATLFAAGRLLRLLSMTKGKLELPADLQISSAPDVAIRGHQLGYRDNNNSYDAWDLKQYEQYIRDQIVFGANAVALIPPDGPDAPQDPLMQIHPWEMNRQLSSLLGSYGLDVWLWVPVNADVADPKQAEEELDRRRELFKSCSHLNHIFVPGGDPGHTPPKILLPWLSRLADALHESHPHAALWVSNQGFTAEQNEVLFGYLRTAEPDWLEGIVFGPWTKHSLAEARARTPSKFRIRRYPDICHTLRCQYPVPDWDPAFCQALGREPYNPRPKAMAHIHNSMAGLADGFVSYSDGVPDDVNKAIWNACSWDMNQSVDDMLTEYGRYFIDQEQGAAVAQGLLALEDNWKGPLHANQNIEKTLAHWQTIERQLPEAAGTNWRLQLALLRANYDAYLRRRLIRHTEIEEAALTQLRKASQTGVKAAIDRAREVLAQNENDRTAYDLRAKMVDLGRLLFKNISLQLDTPNYGASKPDRGAVLDYIDLGLNDRPWMEAQFAEILKLDNEQEQQKRIQQIVNWEDPGEGGFYDDLGHVGRQPHLLPAMRENVWKADPGFVSSPQSEFGNRVNRALLTLNDGKLSWLNQAETLFGKPLQMRYTNLDPNANYRLRVTYAGRFRATMKLLADQTWEVHGPLPQPSKIWPMEFTIPKASTSDGVLHLQWELIAQRGCQVAEVWLIKE